MLNIFDTSAGPNVVFRSSLSVKCCDFIYTIHNITFKSVSSSPLHVKCKVMLLVCLDDLCLCLHFRDLDNLAVLLLVRTFFSNRLLNGIFLMERCIIPIWYRPVPITSMYTPTSDLLGVLKVDSDAETHNEDWKDSSKSKPLVRATNYVLIP